MPEPLKGISRDQLALHDAIAALRRYSLVDATEEFISVHRLVQLVVRDRLDPLVYRAFHTAADELVHAPAFIEHMHRAQSCPENPSPGTKRYSPLPPEPTRFQRNGSDHRRT